MDAKKLNLGGATAQNRQQKTTELRTQFTPRSSWRIFGVKGKYQLRCAGAAPNMRFLGSSPGCPPCELHLLLCHSLNRVQRTLPTTLWIALEAGGGSLFALCGLIGLLIFPAESRNAICGRCVESTDRVPAPTRGDATRDRNLEGVFASRTRSNARRGRPGMSE